MSGIIVKDTTCDKLRAVKTFSNLPGSFASNIAALDAYLVPTQLYHSTNGDRSKVCMVLPTRGIYTREFYLSQSGEPPANLYLGTLTEDLSAIESIVLIGPLVDQYDNQYAVGGLALDPSTGILYGSLSGNFTPTLVRINTTTAQVTPIGPIGRSLVDMEFLIDGSLYGWSPEGINGKIARIDIQTGQAYPTPQQATNTSGGNGSGFASSPDGTLYIAVQRSQGPLRTVDRVVGTSTILGQLNGDPNNYPFSSLIISPNTGSDYPMFAVYNEVFGWGSRRFVRIDYNTLPTIPVTDVLGVPIPDMSAGMTWKIPIIPNKSIQIYTISVNIEEGGPYAQFAVKLPEPAPYDITIPYTVTGTASPNDYVISAPEFTVLAGQTTGTINLTATVDNVPEPPETVIINLGTPSNPNYIVQPAPYNQAEIMITNVDRFVSVVATKTAAIVDSAVQAIFRIDLTVQSDQTLYVTYNTSGTATQGVDYTISPAVVAIPPYTSSAYIVVTPLDDGVPSTQKTTIVTLTGVTGDPKFVLDPTPSKLAAQVYVLDAFQGSLYYDRSSTQFIKAVGDAMYQVGTGDFTIEWYHILNPVGAWNFIWDNSFNYSQWSQFAIPYDFVWHIYFANGTGTFANRGPNGTWVHSAVSCQNGLMRYFTNGTLTAVVGPFNRAGSPSMVLGNSSGGFYPSSPAQGWNGYITNFRVVSSCIYTANFVPSSVPLTAIPGTILLIKADTQLVPEADSSSVITNIMENSNVVWSPLSPFPFP